MSVFSKLNIYFCNGRTTITLYKIYSLLQSHYVSDSESNRFSVKSY